MVQSSKLSDIERENSINRCELCNSIMCSFKYKHNGIDKIGYRCPSPHGLRAGTKKEYSVLEFVRMDELEEI